MVIIAQGNGTLANLLVEWKGINDRAHYCADIIILTFYFLIIKMHTNKECTGLSCYFSKPISNAFQAL